MKITRTVQEIQHLHNRAQKWINIENKGIKKKKKIVGTCYTAQEAQLSAFDDLDGWDKDVGDWAKREGIYVYI